MSTHFDRFINKKLKGDRGHKNKFARLIFDLVRRLLVMRSTPYIQNIIYPFERNQYISANNSH